MRHLDWKHVFTLQAGGEMPYRLGFVTGHVEALAETALYNLRRDPSEPKDLGDQTGPVTGLASSTKARGGRKLLLSRNPSVQKSESKSSSTKFTSP